MRCRIVLFTLLLSPLFPTPLFPTPSLAEGGKNILPAWYVAQQVGEYGPLDCGITIALFRSEAAREIREQMVAQGREELFATPDGRPYPLEQVYIEDLVNLRSLLRIKDDERRTAWNEEIRAAARISYERIEKEGLLK